MEDVDEFPNGSVKKKWIVAGVIVAIVIIAVLWYPLTTTDEPAKEDLRADPYTALRYGREGKLINFTSKRCMGDIVSYNWDFGDGFNSDLVDPSHAYYTAGWYKVTLTVEDRSGNTDNASIIIGVQPVSKSSYVSADNLINPGLSPLYGGGTEIRVGPNIDHPDVSVWVDIYQPFGEFLINITLKTWFDNNSVETDLLFSDSYVENKGFDINFDYVIPRTEFPDKVSNHYSTVEVEVYLLQGRWYWAEIDISTQFYIKWLDPPLL